MTILSANLRVDYTGNGSTSIFSYTFKILAKTDLVVTKKDTSGVETTLVVDVDYTVSGVGADAGGTITLNAGNLPTGYALTIRRKRPILQETSIRNQSTFFPSIHEDEFDSLTMIDQQQQEQIDRSLKLPETEVPSDLLTTLPKSTDRSSKFLAFDASGNPIASSGGISPAIPVSAFIQTVLDDVDAPSARTTLGAVAKSGDTLSGGLGTTAAAPSTPVANTLYKDNLVKAYVNFDGSGGSPSIRKAFNVSAISKVSTGVYKLTFATAMADANYTVIVTPASYSGSFIFGMQDALATFTPTTTQVQIKLSSDAGAPADSNSINVLIMGSQ